jgi:hypothetical protein
MQYFVCACSAMAKDSLAQSIGSGGELLRLACVVGRQDLEVLLDRRHDASRCAWAGLGAEPSRISWQVHEMLACPLPMSRRTYRS